MAIQTIHDILNAEMSNLESDYPEDGNDQLNGYPSYVIGEVLRRQDNNTAFEDISTSGKNTSMNIICLGHVSGQRTYRLDSVPPQLVASIVIDELNPTRLTVNASMVLANPYGSGGALTSMHIGLGETPIPLDDVKIGFKELEKKIKNSERIVPVEEIPDQKGFRKEGSYQLSNDQIADLVERRGKILNGNNVAVVPAYGREFQKYVVATLEDSFSGGPVVTLIQQLHEATPLSMLTGNGALIFHQGPSTLVTVKDSNGIDRVVRATLKQSFTPIKTSYGWSERNIYNSLMLATGGTNFLPEPPGGDAAALVPEF